jgi:RNA polymerase sigma factor (sigma-70 family)
MAMASGESASVARSLGTLFSSGTAVGLSDAQLLERFASGRDNGASFEALLTRHGPMVLGVCREILRDPHAAEDAFQATFLVLVRRASAVRVHDSLGRWLYGVAFRVATRARSDHARRRSKEAPGLEADAIGSHPADRDDLAGVIHEELARLPDSQRAAVVLCHLEGLTHEEAARQLRWPVGTVRSRLARARERLRERLTRRGFAPAVLLPSQWPGFSPLPEPLRRATLHAALKVAAGQAAVTAGAVSATVASLTEGVLSTMFLTKLKWVAAIVVATGGVLTTAGVAVLARQDPPRPAPEAPAPAAVPAPVTTPRSALTPAPAPAAPSPVPLPGSVAAPVPEAPPRAERVVAPAPVPTEPAPPPSLSAPAALPSAESVPAPAATPSPVASPAADPFAGLDRSTLLPTQPTTSAYVLAAKLAQARERLAWSEQMYRKGFVSAGNLAAARFAVEGIEAEIQGLLEDIGDQLELLDIQLESRRGEVLAAKARKRRSQGTLSQLQQLAARNRENVSSLEMDQAQAEVAERDAETQVKEQAVKEIELRIKQTQRRLDAIAALSRKLRLEPGGDARVLPPAAEAPPPPPPTEAPRPAAPSPSVPPAVPTALVPGGEIVADPSAARPDANGMIKVAYPVSDLVGSQQHYRSLVELIRLSIEPRSWADEEAGLEAAEDKGAIVYFMLNQSLIVRQTPDVHQQIVQFLRLLRRLPVIRNRVVIEDHRLEPETPPVPDAAPNVPLPQPAQVAPQPEQPPARP